MRAFIVGLTTGLLCIAISVTIQAQRRRAVGGGVRPAEVAAPGEPFASLSAAERAAFTQGRREFIAGRDVNGGLGPVFNESSCFVCHLTPGVGGTSIRTVTRFAARNDTGIDPLVNLGGSLMQDHSIGPHNGSPHLFRRENVPPEANLVVRRRTTSLFGLGLVDATPDATFIALAQEQAARGDGTAGRVNLVDNIRAGMKTVGKFGWKAQMPTLFQFSGEAYLNEMGITSPDFPEENCPQGNCAELAFNPAPGLNDGGEDVAAVADFMRMLAPSRRGPQTPDTAEGEAAFERVGCGACHVATLTTGASSIAALDRRTYHPYSDFLLHDMGSLGDSLEMGDARTTEMRTAPLWGLRFSRSFLHDGRVRTIEEAILAHDGQGRGARDRYVALAADVKAKVLAFLQSL